MKLRLWYDHMRENHKDFSKSLRSAVSEAVNSDQIGLHAITGLTSASCATAFTRCRVMDENGNVLSEGFSFFTPDEDFPREQFRKDRGRKQARDRAIKQLWIDHGLKFNVRTGEVVKYVEWNKASQDMPFRSMPCS